jgi:catechol 2,3-dioxygenase-like lactoylglutathione lyase family enzyme
VASAPGFAVFARLIREHGVELINLADENPTSSRKAWKEFLEALLAESVKVPIVGSTRVDDSVHDSDILHLYKQASCIRFLQGLDGMDEAILKTVREDGSRAEDQQAIALVRQHGMIACPPLPRGSKKKPMPIAYDCCAMPCADTLRWAVVSGGRRSVIFSATPCVLAELSPNSGRQISARTGLDTARLARCDQINPIKRTFEMGTGSPPSPWAALMAEMMVEDYPRSLAFWSGPMGFAVAFTRPAQKLACLAHSDGAQVMIYQRDGYWETGPMQAPFGRGMVVQVYVSDAEEMAVRMTAAGVPFYVALREKWRDWGDRMGGQREFLVQDPDGYLVMVAQRIGERPLP